MAEPHQTCRRDRWGAATDPLEGTMRKFRIARRVLITATVSAGLLALSALPALADTLMYHHS